MWKNKAQKYGYHEYRNKKRIALITEEQRDLQTYHRHIQKYVTKM